MTFIVVSFDGCFLEGSVHTLNPTVGPRMIRFGKAMFHIILQTNTIKDM
ncbi:hypothetical protein SAMN05216339_102371 [Nitrosomonas eutropha]|uniref:Uncharacterized protein n=1 Tax=Nitrosomonas eutropha TaxID=916 RepID=A0A1I7GD90_9PROT|nr:hypothetical protein SAMN05216339_102371 [Nitrosomonas eutropha]